MGCRVHGVLRGANCTGGARLTVTMANGHCVVPGLFSRRDKSRREPVILWRHSAGVPNFGF